MGKNGVRRMRGGRSFGSIVSQNIRAMKKKIIAVFAALQLVVLAAFAQNTTTITGFVKDEKGDPLPFASVLLGNGDGTWTDFDGQFSIILPIDVDEMEMTVSFVGYGDEQAFWVNGQPSKKMEFTLKAGIELTPIVITCAFPVIEQEFCCACGLASYHCFPTLSNKPKIDEEQEEKTKNYEASMLTTYPNPFISTLNVEMEVSTPQPYLFHLYNEGGQLVFAESRELEAGLQTFQLDLVQRHLPEGIYFLRISDGAGEVRTKRLVKVSP
ncbi:MAG: carboxypeptidase-like regulatory domain-containing protein [Bacteroidetes bacterium]|nr:carboxypeptidase-like regulatory domain-containing protein [Bacteroidota bacterium]